MSWRSRRTRSASVANTSIPVAASGVWKKSWAASSGMKMCELSYSNMPTLKTATILYERMRGRVPSGDAIPSGAMSEIRSPGSSPSFCARR